MDATGGIIVDGFLCAGLSVYVDDRGCQARDKFMAMAIVHGKLHAGSGISCFIYHVPGWAFAGVQLADGSYD